MPPSRFFLDTMLWDQLEDSERGTDLLVKLRSAIRSGAIQILGSLSLLEEILSGTDRKKAHRRAELLFELVKDKWMRETVERVGLEIASEGSLDDNSLYLPRRDRRKIEKLASSKSESLEIAEQVQQLKVSFKEEEEEARKRVAKEMESRPGSAEMRSVFRSWFEEVDVADWGLEVLSTEDPSALKERGLQPTQEAVPSLWFFVKFKLARLVLCVGDDRRIDPSDLYDMKHYAAATYLDALVTEDQRFRETCELITETPFQIWDTQKLTDTLNTPP